MSTESSRFPRFYVSKITRYGKPADSEKRMILDTKTDTVVWEREAPPEGWTAADQADLDKALVEFRAQE